MNACKFGAITLADGIAKIDPKKCTGCGACMKTCPRSIINLLPRSKTVVVLCRNQAVGKIARTQCKVACIGCGRCAKSCPSDAIHVENGVAKVQPWKCTGCGICTRQCPNKLIDLRRAVDYTLVRCSNTQKGAQTRVACGNGCIGCKKCEKVCPTGAITVVDNLARIDYDKCVGCVACSENCPVGVIQRL